jgi:nucleoside-diphosphate-sugar epimerase
VAGNHEGPFGPGDLNVGQSFRNAYEQSKCEAEERVRRAGLPFQVVRPSIVVGDQHTGETSAFNVIYGPLRAYSAGVLNVVPGRAAAPVDLIPVDVVTDGMLALLGEPAGGTHLLVAGPKAPTVGEFVERAAEHFGRPKALLIDPAELDEVVAKLEPAAASGARRALDQAGALLPYFDVRCRFEDPATVGILERNGITVPHLADYLDRMIDFAVGARWGKRPGFYTSPVPAQPEVVS